MLEAIIAFMPIKEDHVAIGSIDCSKEMRKNFATSSQSFKCDICGNISDILKPRVVGKDKKEEDVKESGDNNGNMGDKKDNGKDDIKESISDDNKESNEEVAETLKDIITSFNKDNVNETNINDGTDKLNTLDDIISTQSQYHQPSIQINKNINNNPTIDYFSSNTNRVLNQSTTTSNINTQTTTTTNNTPKPTSQTQTQPTLHEQQHIPPFYDEFLEEFSFYKIQNTIKCHYTKSKEEIDTEIKHLQTNPQPPLKSTPTSHPSSSAFHTPSSSSSPLKPFPSIETPPIDPPSDLETKIKQRIYFNKVLTREKYDKIKKEKLRNLNITMMIVMISIILLYDIITKFIY